MNQHKSGRGRNMLQNLSQHYTLHRIDIGDDARLSKSGFVFDISVYEIEDVGHLCMMNMKAMCGLMRMETVVLSATQKDAPLLNIDWVKVPGKPDEFCFFFWDLVVGYECLLWIKHRAPTMRDDVLK